MDFIATAAGIREFVERRGNIGYAFYDVVGPGHPNGLAASIAARCAGAQGGYEEARLSLFARQSDWAATAVTPIPAATVVAPLILNEPAFSQCVRSDTTMARVEKVLAANLRRALSLGVTKTPTWVVWRDTTPQLLRGAIDSIRLAALLQ
jgi:protein-disulfide isomerase